MAVVDLELNADLRKATKDIAKFSKDSNSALDGLKSGFKTLAAAAGAVAGAFAVKKVVDAAAQQEQAIRSLNTALALTGDFSEENSKRFQEFASELQKNSTIGDEVSLSMVALAKSMGATNEQTEKIIQAAADMSAVTGESLESSVRNLTKTLGGLKGELGETQPELRTLTAEQLKNGDAIEILSKKYRGTARELTKTFSGAVTQTQNSFGDLLEEIGFLITENPIVIKAINATSQAFSDLGAFVKANRKSIINFTVDAVAGLVKGFSFVIDIIGDVVAVFKNYDAVIDLTILSMADLAAGTIDVASTIVKALKSAVNFGMKPLLKGVEAVGGALNSLGIVSDESLGSLQMGLKQISLDSSSSGFEKMRADVEAFRNVARQSFIESADRLGETKDGFSTASDSVANFADQLSALKDSGDDANVTLTKLSKANKAVRVEAEAAAEAAKANISFQQQQFGKIGQTTITGAGILSAGGAVATGVQGGAQGANQLFAQGAGLAADAFLPGSGAIAGPLASLLALGPEAAEAQTQAFIDQIPVIIDNIVEALPVITETLAENSDEIIIAMAEASPKIIQAMAIEAPLAFAKSLPGALQGIFERFAGNADEILAGVVTKFATSFGTAIEDLVNGLGGLIEDLFGDLLNKLLQKVSLLFNLFVVQIPSQIFEQLSSLGDKIIEPIRNFFDRLNIPGISDIIGGSGGGGILGTVRGGFSSVTSALGFAEGGAVPAGFPNDTFPARLSSGENVVDRSTNEKLNAFLDSGGGPTQVVLQVGERQLAEVLLNLNRQGFRTS